ncbi:uncharacterized protein LOC133817300 [Humulus lupulus]|uniref:uncharacterized protein LOC133817300 n=1 Tax=Humulus lupulus TaxID=3486 RepID=UPI002B4029A2|nr:uncharacterized protein LOC133817300 [Humulus lupulus]
MPIAKRRKNKPKPAKFMNHTTTALIHQSSPTIQFQGLSDLNFQEGGLRFSAMEDSSNGIVEETPEVIQSSQDEYKEVVVGDVKNVEIHNEDDDSEPANKREISIFEQVIDKAEDFLDGDDHSSSSSSSSDDEIEAAEPEEKSPQVEESSENKDDLKQVEEEEVAEENALTSLVEAEEIPQVLDDLVSKIEAVTSVVSGGSEEPELPLSDQKNETNNDDSSAMAEQVIDHSKGTEENPGESTEEAAPPACEASNENIPENTTDSPIEPLTSESLQPTSWRSCCGLFEVLRPSER